MKSSRRRPIGIFDSGLGGLTVLRSVHRELPGEDLIYFGDTARVPYGNKSKETIKRFASEITSFLINKNVKVIVVACNTASSLSLTYLKKLYRIPVIGVITPGVSEAVKTTKNGRIGIIGTRSTIQSRAYQSEIARISGKYRIYTQSCPLFVPLVENRFIKDPVTVKVAKKYLKKFTGTGIDTLILGCTHYPVLEKVIRKVLKRVKLIDSSRAVAMEVRTLLDEKGLLSEGKSNGAAGTIRCFVSDDVKGFTGSSRIFLKDRITVRKAVL